jgi:lysophospholipase L1-like esterase
MANKRSYNANLVLSSVLLFGSLLLSMILGEVLLRALGYAGAPESQIGNIYLVNDHVLNWRFIPYSRVQDGKIEYAYNSEGFRDAEHAKQKPPGVIRLVVIGDSVTEGAGVEVDEIFTSRLQQILGPLHEVINLGMSGLNTPQEVHVLELAGLGYDPDVVIVNFVLNDCDFFSEFNAAQQFTREKDAKIGLLGDINIDPRIKRWLKSSAFVYFVKSRVEHLVGMATGKGESNYYRSLWSQEYCYQRVTEGFDRLKDLHAKNAFEIHVIIWPLLVDYKPYAFAHIHERVKREAETRGFKVLDLVDTFAALSYRKLQVTAEDNVHPNGVGHRIAAETYLEWMHKLWRNPGVPLTSYAMPWLFACGTRHNR